MFKRSDVTTPQPPKRFRWWRFWRVVIVLGVWTGIAVAVLAVWTIGSLPTTDLAAANHHPSVVLRAADGSLIATFGDLNGEQVKLKDLPKALPDALIATEDRRFYSHVGIDPIGILRAVLADVTAGRLAQGGSTITQQVAKNLFLTPDRTAKRKIQEMILALWLEQHYSKDEILETYLNRVYFGAGTYGVDAAARRYFGKPAKALNTYECALLAGLVKAPSRFSPAHDPELAAKRTDQVLANMVDAGFMTQAQAAAVRKQSTVLASVPMTQPGLRYFADWIQDQANSFGLTGDLTVMTTLDPRMQAAAETAVAATLDKYGPKAAASQAALIAMSPDGAVRAMVGGRDYTSSQFNRAVQAQRQPGSSFKLFVYLTALEQGMHPDDMVVDEPVRIGNWQPQDFEKRYLGDIPMSEAVAQSLNTVAAQVIAKVGVGNVVATAHRLGITSTLNPDASLALGTGEVSLIDLTSAYGVMASGGYGVWPYGITEIRDARGAVVYRREGGGPGRLVQPEYVAEMNGMLEGVLDHGTGKAARIDRPAAGKTGTTSDFRDALFVGYTPDLIAGVWFGNDDNSPMNHVTGGSLPALAWKRFMLAALRGKPVQDLPVEETSSPSAQLPENSDELADLLNRAEHSPGGLSALPAFQQHGGKDR